jgi:hypothetical protein
MIVYKNGEFYEVVNFDGLKRIFSFQANSMTRENEDICGYFNRNTGLCGYYLIDCTKVPIRKCVTIHELTEFAKQ